MNWQSSRVLWVGLWMSWQVVVSHGDEHESIVDLDLVALIEVYKPGPPDWPS